MSEYDALVVGSGAGGGTCAFALAEAGLQVLLLEAGPDYDPYADYRLHRADWEQAGFPHKLSPWRRQTYAPLQGLEPRWEHLRSRMDSEAPEVDADTRRVVGYRHVAGVGGSTLHFSGEAHRLHPQAMRMRSRFGVAADWPLDYEQLEPYYSRAERLLGVAGPEAGGARPRSAPYPLPAHALSYAARRLGEGCRALGLGWEPNSLAILSAPRDGRPACNYCAGCQRGCPRRDKGSVDVTFIARARASGRCTVRSGCQAVRVEAGAGERVKGVHYRDAQGREHFQSARVLVLAGGAVETPRLLLASEGPAAPRGLANESGQVGRNFMETLSWVASGLHPEPLGSHRGVPVDGICWDYNAPDAIAGVVGGCRFSHATAEADLVGPIAYAQRLVGGWGREHKARMRSAFGRALSVGALGEFLPNERSFVDLDPVQRDAHGMPKARIHSHLPETELKRLEFMARTCTRILEAAGVERVLETFGTYDHLNASHVFGTCRMGEDPDTSVVDGSCRSHRWRNLYVVDASVFPSSGGGEAPSLTIEALALRAGEHIARALVRRE